MNKKLIWILLVAGIAIGLFLYSNAGLEEQAYIDQSMVTPEASPLDTGDTALMSSASFNSTNEVQPPSPMTAAINRVIRVVRCVGQENTSLPKVLGEPNTVRQKSGGEVEWRWATRFYHKMEEMPSTIDTVVANVSPDRRIAGVTMVLSTQLTRWMTLRDFLLATDQGSDSSLEVYFDKGEMAHYQSTRQKPYKGFLYLGVVRYYGLVMSVHAYSDFPPVKVEPKMDYQTSTQQQVVTPLYTASELKYLDMKIEGIQVASGDTKVTIPRNLSSIFNPPPRL